jgi:hypothetical protein|tara:strand:+ start:437 stop:1069 length:633 start_codon:yes stop_codon:yes gene_type:complete
MIELIDFINQEKINKNINCKKIISYFNKCIIKSINEFEIKFNKIENKHNSIISGINMIYNIFFILIFYSNNIKLTVFLVERSILLYTEFIIMSQDKKIIDEICFIPNITDAITFSYKKTIGPLNIKKLNIKNEHLYIKDIGLIIKSILIKSYLDNINYEEYINELQLKLIEIFNNKNFNDETNLINYINHVLQSNTNNKLETIKDHLNSY